MSNFINIKKIELRNNYYIIYSDKIYYLKKVSYDIDKVFDYFKEIDFSYYGERINNNAANLMYCINYDYIGKIEGEKLIEVLVSLQEKSCIINDYIENEKKEIYDNIHFMIEERMKYYLNLQDIIDDYDFPPPSYYLLVKNISKFYKLLHYSFIKLDEWYNNSDNKYREVFLISDVCFNNFYTDNDSSYFLDYGSGDRGVFIKDFVSFYRNELFNVEINCLFNLYCDKFLLKDFEKSLLFSLIAIPNEIFFSENYFIDTIKVRKVVDYVDYTLKFLLEKDEKDKETDEEKFKEENNDINLSGNED